MHTERTLQEWLLSLQRELNVCCCWLRSCVLSAQLHDWILLLFRSTHTLLCHTQRDACLCAHSGSSGFRDHLIHFVFDFILHFAMSKCKRLCATRTHNQRTAENFRHNFTPHPKMCMTFIRK